MTDPRKDPRRRCMRFEEWPVVDREFWLAATDRGDALDDGGPAAHWSAHSRRKRIEGYGRWLTFLQFRGLLDETTHPVDRVTSDAARAYVDELGASVRPVTVLCRTEDLYAVMRVFAPARDWWWLRRLANQLRTRCTETQTNEPTVRSSSELYELGLELMGRADTAVHVHPSRRATLYRDGLIIALLGARPVRRRNLASIEIGRHLSRVEDRYWMHFDAHETKTGQPIDVPLPPDLTERVDRYLACYRRHLVGKAETDRLWVSERATPLAANTIAHQVMKRTADAWGQPVCLHRFRDALATSVAIDDPDHVRMAATLLGHASLRTTQRYYDHSRMLAAGRRYQDRITRLRGRLRRELKYTSREP
jgi:site-specific recombinase XerD